MYKKTKSAFILPLLALAASLQISGAPKYVTHIIETNPNKDGCIINAVNNKLSDRKTLQANFVKQGNIIKEVDSIDVYQGRNMYTIKALPCLRQTKSGPCGFYSIFHLSQLYKHNSLLDRQALENAFPRKYRNCKNSCSQAMQKYVNLNMNYFNGKNFTIASGEHEANQKLLVYSDGKQEKVPDKFLDRVKEFQKNGTPQYLVIGTDADIQIEGIELDWDNKNDRRNCVSNHWIAIKLEWLGEAGQSPVKISVADSGSPKDPRYAERIHFYYYKFVHAHNFYQLAKAHKTTHLNPKTKFRKKKIKHVNQHNQNPQKNQNQDALADKTAHTNTTTENEKIPLQNYNVTILLLKALYFCLSYFSFS